MSMYFIVTNPLGLQIYPLMNLQEKPFPNPLRFGDGFTAYETFTKSATQFWARINVDGFPKQYVLISIGSKIYADLHPNQPESIDIAPAEILKIYRFAILHGYTGPNPFTKE